MSEFSKPACKIKFHFSDIISLLPPHILASRTHKPPQREDGTFFPDRKCDRDGLVQLIEYVTGQEIPSEGDPVDTVKTMSALADKIAPAIARKYPELAKLARQFCREIPAKKSQTFQDVWAEVWVRDHARKLGHEYFEVDRMEIPKILAKAKRHQRDKSPGSGEFGFPA